MARYLATSIPSRSELLPDPDESIDLAFDALLDDNERRRLKSYRPPVVDADKDVHLSPTVRWTQAEIDALLAIARATVEPSDAAHGDSRASTIPPPPPHVTPRVVRRSDVIIADVRDRLRRDRDD